jgi:copper chaperone CopZ
MRQLIAVQGLMLITVALGLGCNKSGAPSQGAAADPTKPSPPPAASYPVTAEKTGIFICCGECEKQVKETLGKVDGIGPVTCDLKKKVVTYKAKNGAAATAGNFALEKAGFGGQYKDDAPASDNKTFLTVGERLGGSVVDSLEIKGVHVCCEGCEKAIRDLFKDAEVTFDGTGPQKTVKVKGKNLNDAAAWNALKRAGFSPQY